MEKWTDLTNNEPHTLKGDILDIKDRINNSSLNTKVATVLGVAAVLVVGGIVINHNEQEAVAQRFEQTQKTEIAVAEARRDSIDTLALSNPANTALSVVAEFTVLEGSNISTEAFKKLSEFIERRKANGDQPLEGLANADTTTLNETILESGRALETSHPTQPGDLFLVSQVELKYDGTEQIVYVVQKP